ncbi:hypothetical protein BD309DRAFT_985100 [Dichomitus squalens]|nr:hypothetical protein BD309DRAFT_985100 [Dichomitus squalens]
MPGTRPGYPGQPLLTVLGPLFQNLPQPVKALITTAKKFGVRMDGLAVARNILRELPMWFHAHADPETMAKLAANTLRETKCLKAAHRISTVGEFETLAACKAEPGHVDSDHCRCLICKTHRSGTGCRHPHSCFARAESIMDTLPPKWDPRTPQPEDYEQAPEEADEEENYVPFDPRITVHGTIVDTFRIFTETTPPGLVPPDTRIEQDRPLLTVGTDGSCLNNSERNAQAGAGVFVEPGHPANRSVRLPTELEQSNQTGELVGTLIATQ